jgi:hypothetical protein
MQLAYLILSSISLHFCCNRLYSSAILALSSVAPLLLLLLLGTDRLSSGV